jgi:hypothetical protein
VGAPGGLRTLLDFHLQGGAEIKISNGK